MENDRPDLWPEAVPMWLKTPAPATPPPADDDEEPAP